MVVFLILIFSNALHFVFNYRPYIGIVANMVFDLAVKFKIVQAWDEPSPGSYAMLPGPGSSRAEAERRR